MNNTGEIIKKLRKEKNITQEQLGDIIGVKKSAIAKYESGRVENLKRSSIEKLANFFNVSPSYLLDIKDDPNIISLSSVHNQIKIPIFKYIPASCGYGSYSEDDVCDYILIPMDLFKMNRHKKYFAQIASGDSMIGAGIEDGDILIFEECNVPENNVIGSFSINNEKCVCKRYKVIGNKIYLVSENSNYMPIQITEDVELRMVGILKITVNAFKQLEER